MGKLVVLGIVLVTGFMASVLYTTFKNHSYYEQTVTTRLKDEFISYSTKIEGTQKLQVAELKQVELFERTSSLSMFWDSVKLPDVVVSITLPVTYTYYVDLKKPWNFEIHGKNLFALVPDLEFNPPAADLSASKFEIKKGSVFRNETAALNGLKGQLTALLNERAKTNEALITDAAKKQISEFLTTWLRTELPKEKSFDIKIQFQSEIAPAAH